MASCRLLTALLLLTAAVTANAQTVGPSTPATCVGGTWVVLADYHQLGGVSNPAATIDDCKAACSKVQTCVAVDWNAGSTDHCWMIDSSTAGALQPLAGITHYSINRTAGSGSCNSYCPSWNVTNDIHIAGGTATNDATLADCQKTCENKPGCTGVDWDTVTTGPTKCYQTPANVAPSPAPGVNHYSLSSVPCDQSTSGCILFVNNQGVLTATGAGGAVFVTDDISLATVVVQRPCLGSGVGGAAAFNDCYSYEARDKAGFYLRDACPWIYLQTLNQSGYPDRFREDASFFKHVDTPAANFFTLESTVSKQSYVTAGPPGSIAQVAGSGLFSPVSLYCGKPPPSPQTYVKDTCPYVWRLIEGAVAVANTITSMMVTDSAVCRKYCIVSPQCIGASFGSGTCILVKAANGSQQSLASDPIFRHYDLLREAPETCSRGCLYTWVKKAASGGSLYRHTLGVITQRQCRLDCINDLSCVGNQYDAATNTCTEIRNTPGTPPNNTDPVLASGTDYYALTREIQHCGSCVTHWSTVFNASDAAAVLAGTTVTNRQCRTICINQPSCTGYEMRGSDCYVSLAFVTLVEPSPYNRNGIIRPTTPCGFGCVHSWLLYADTSIVNGTTVFDNPATTEQDCRQACIADTTCYSVHWDPQSVAGTSRCRLAREFNVAVKYGTPGVNYYELSRNYLCD